MGGSGIDSPQRSRVVILDLAWFLNQAIKGRTPGVGGASVHAPRSRAPGKRGRAELAGKASRVPLNCVGGEETAERGGLWGGGAKPISLLLPCSPLRSWCLPRRSRARLWGRAPSPSFPLQPPHPHPPFQACPRSYPPTLPSACYRTRASASPALETRFVRPLRIGDAGDQPGLSQRCGEAAGGGSLPASPRCPGGNACWGGRAEASSSLAAARGRCGASNFAPPPHIHPGAWLATVAFSRQ